MSSFKLNTGYEMPAVGLGMWQSREGIGQAAVECAIDCGYRLFDSAFAYENEEEIGRGIQNKIKDKKVKREDLFISDKLWCTYHNPKEVKPMLLETLKNYKLDYLDLYLIHWPMGYLKQNDRLIPVDNNDIPEFDDTDYVDTWKAMEELQKEGLVRSLGVSNFNQFQLSRILNECSIRPAVNQIEMHPYLTQKEMAEFCNEKGIVITAYSPFGSATRPWAEQGDPVLMEDSRLLEISARLKKTLAQVLLRYLFQRGVVSIPKSSNPKRIKENLEIFDFVLSEDDMKIMDGCNRNFRYCAMKPFKEHKYYPFKEPYTE